MSGPYPNSRCVPRVKAVHSSPSHFNLSLCFAPEATQRTFRLNVSSFCEIRWVVDHVSAATTSQVELRSGRLSVLQKYSG